MFKDNQELVVQAFIFWKAECLQAPHTLPRPMKLAVFSSVLQGAGFLRGVRDLGEEDEEEPDQACFWVSYSSFNHSSSVIL